VIGGREIPWYLADGAINIANTIEHAESPAVGQLVTATVAGGQPWTIAARTNYVPATNGKYLFDSQSGRIIVGAGSIGTGENGWYTTDSGWKNVAPFAAGNHTYFLISNGTAVQMYRDGVAVGTPGNSNEGIGGSTRWRSTWSNPASSVWPAEVPVAAIYNIALDATQRTALHTSMMDFT